MSSADALARQIADLRRRLTAVERAARLPRSSIDGGALTVTDDTGTPVLTVGAQPDGTYAVTGENGGAVVANTLDLPAGSITETDIADDSISTPKLRANAVTADKIEAGAITAEKIAADAITGKTITGGLFQTAATGNRLEIGEGVYTPTGEAALRWHLAGGDWTEPFIAGGSEEAGRFVILRSGVEGGIRSAVKIGADYVRIQSGTDTAESTLVLTPSGWSLNGRQMGTGRIGYSQSTANSAAFFAEASVLSIGSVTFKSGRAYRVRVGGNFTMTATGIVRARLRDRTTGPFPVEWADLGHFPATVANNPFDLSKTVYLRRTAGTDLTGQTLALTIQASVAGTVHAATATSPRWIEIEDCGDAFDFPYAVAV